ncbi:Alanine racemase [Candidatus Syntrophocurvum alkaliphilum]|uniref:Alanine racemase n=1 Tax=Candidatus Syntrophocurvum alkaliphilum TaxID=2293317 RepID=A0A6I6DDY0_9FIRM|nr:alanine racemase [Candidatus Syntrophocurvum alkaliphilum]QGT98741.1 Alanine racemase [Candidatus Syntrophocurvum alkaliphilum]
MDNLKLTWVEIDLSAIRHNINEVKSLLKPETKLMVIVKANAYGHGMLEVTRICLEEGVDYLGVASLDEALTLRKEGIKSPILVLGYIPNGTAETIIDNNIIPSVFTISLAEELSKVAVSKGKEVNVHLKVDTGMGRLGIVVESRASELVERVNLLPGVNIEGIFTHFAVADAKDKTYTKKQIEVFNEFLKNLEEKGIHIPIKHSSNSAAIMDLPEAHYDMVRAGIVTYGLYPSDEVDRKKIDLIPAMTLKSKVSFVKTLSKGSSVSYGRTFIASKNTVVATVPIGYADGYTRLLSNKIWASIKGKKVPLIGNVCMDQCMFDVTGVDGIKDGEEIILFGKPEFGITADDIADTLGTINYEIVSAISSRVPRLYIG